MADIVVDGKVKVYLVASISNPAAPTTTELNAGTDISSLLTPDGLAGFEPDTADVDNSALSSQFGTVLPGRAQFGGTMLRLKKASGTDTLYNTLVRDLVTNVVIRRNGSLQSVAWASGNQVEVYPVQTGETRNLAPESNSVQKYEVPLKVTASPTIRASVP